MFADIGITVPPTTVTTASQFSQFSQFLAMPSYPGSRHSRRNHVFADIGIIVPPATITTVSFWPCPVNPAPHTHAGITCPLRWRCAALALGCAGAGVHWAALVLGCAGAGRGLRQCFHSTQE